MVDLRTSIANPTDPWVAAKNRFLLDLDDNEKSLFEKATLENLFYAASAGFKQQQNDSVTAQARMRLKPLLDNLEGYEKALDVFSQSSTSILCPIWGSIKVVLHLAREHQKYYDELLEMYEWVGDCVPTFRTFEALFATHEALLASIADAYLIIVKFSYDASKVFLTTPTSGFFKHSKSLKQRWTPFKDNFKHYRDNFRKQKQKVQDQASRALMIESMKMQDMLLADQARRNKKAELDEYRKFKGLISDYDYMGKHRSISQNRLKRTGAWLLQNSVFQSWVQKEGSSTLCCFGIPGSGKTMLASAIIDKALTNPGDLPLVTCFHYCDYAEAKSLDGSKIIGNITRQLLDRLDILPSVAVRAAPCLESGFPLHINELQFYLGEGLKKHESSLIVIDGIDELTTEWQRTLFDAIGKLGGSPDYHAKVLLFCRGRESQDWELLKDVLSIEITANENGADLEAFIERNVRQKVDAGDLAFNDPSLKRDILEKLKEGALDMFLWAKLQIEELCFARSDDAMREVLANLPKTLVQTYDRIVHRIAQSPIGTKRLQLTRKVLMWIVCARRPLTLDELQEATAIEGSDRFLQRDKMANPKQIQDACSNLVTFSTQNRTLRLAHQTVQQYLLNTLNTSDDSTASTLPHELSTAFFFSWDEAKHNTSAACLTYIEYSDFKTQFTNTTRVDYSTSNHHFSPDMWRDHLQPSAQGYSLLSLAAILQKRKKKDRIVFQAQLRARAPSPTLQQSYMMLDYISLYWAWHVNATLHESNPPPPFVFTEAVPIDFRPWANTAKSHESGKQMPHFELLRWLVSQDLEWFVKFLPGIDDYMLVKPTEGALLLRALEARTTNVALYFASRYSRMYPLLDVEDRKLIQVASSMPDPTILTALLEHDTLWAITFDDVFRYHCEHRNLDGVENIVGWMLSSDNAASHRFVTNTLLTDPGFLDPLQRAVAANITAYVASVSHSYWLFLSYSYWQLYSGDFKDLEKADRLQTFERVVKTSLIRSIGTCTRSGDEDALKALLPSFELLTESCLYDVVKSAMRDMMKNVEEVDDTIFLKRILKLRYPHRKFKRPRDKFSLKTRSGDLQSFVSLVDSYA